MRILSVQLQMTKRQSKEARFFCLPDELTSLLTPILVKAGVQLCVATKLNGFYHFRTLQLPEDLRAVDPQFYVGTRELLGPPTVSSLANLVEVWFPAFTSRTLRMGRIAMLMTESELPQSHRDLYQGIYRDAREAITKSFSRGVVGKNSKTGGQHFYEDIFISEGARCAHREGVALASLMGDGYVTYHVNPDSPQ
jgi:hypothetical protein